MPFLAYSRSELSCQLKGHSRKALTSHSHPIFKVRNGFTYSENACSSTDLILRTFAHFKNSTAPQKYNHYPLLRNHSFPKLEISIDKAKWLLSRGQGLQGPMEGANQPRGAQRKRERRHTPGRGPGMSKGREAARAWHVQGPSSWVTWSDTRCMRPVSPEMTTTMGTINTHG